jgi:hypothetical protein
MQTKRELIQIEAGQAFYIDRTSLCFDNACTPFRLIQAFS